MITPTLFPTAAPKHGPLRATLRRLAKALEDVLTPCLPNPGRTLADAYRGSTTPACSLQLLDYIEELLKEREEARQLYTENVQVLLKAWQRERRAGGDAAFFDLKCRELTGRGLHERAPAPVAAGT
jgi:hypothetical protein